MKQYRTEEGFTLFPKGIVGDNRYVLVHTIRLCEDRTGIRIPDIVGYNTAFLFEMFLPLSRRHLGFLERSSPVTVTVEGTVTGDGDILCVTGIERRGAAFGGYSFEPLIEDLVEIEVV